MRVATRSLTSRFLVVAVFASCCGGCAGEFDPPSLVNSLRALAIKAEPPMLSMSPNDTTKLSALVAGAATDAALCHAWGICAFALQGDGTYRCADDELSVPISVADKAVVTFAHIGQLIAGATKLGQQRGAPSSRSGTGGAPDIADFSVLVHYAVADKAAMGGTCPADIDAFLAQGCSDRERCVIGRKSLKFSDTVKTNPQLKDLAVEAGDPIVKLTPDWTSDEKTALFSWFTTSGEYAKQRSFEDVPGNELTLDGAERPRVWVVMRDTKGGVDWLDRQL